MANGLIWLGVVVYASSVSAEWYDTYTGNQITELRLQDLRLNNLIPYCAVEVKECDIEEPRRMDASCNNIHYPPRGARMTPFERLLPPDYAIGGGLKTTKMGMPLPNARRLRMSLVPDARISNKRFTHLLTNMAVFISGDTTTVHDTINYLVMTTTCCMPGGDQDPRCMPIRVPNDDLYLRNTNVRCLNLTRAITYQRLGCIPDTLPPERVNVATPILDLSHVYGTETPKALRVRSMSGGRLRTEKLKGKDWPPGNGAGCVLNEPARNETRCHEAAEVNVNSLLPVNMAFIWFVRQHNYLADQLAKVNPCWDDDKLYTVAKDINIAIWQNIVYYGLFPNILGFEFLVKAGVIFPDRGHVDDYDPRLEPRTYLEQVITSRWFHTLQEGRLNLYDNHGKVLRQLAVVELTLHTGILPNNNTIEGLTQGTFRQPCASNDKGMDPDMGQRVLGPMQTVADVMADDIMKARDAGLPSYNRYREFCHLPAAKDFDDLMEWMPKTHVESLKLLYDDVEDIELMTGILSEKPAVGLMPPTLACIMVEQLIRWRRSDRFWFENISHKGRFTPEQLREIRKMTISKVICDHGDSVDAVQYDAFQLPGPGNELIPCLEYPDIDFEAWRDHSCAPKDAYNQVYQYTGDYAYQELQNYMNTGETTTVSSQRDP